MATKVKATPEIQQAAIFRCTSRESREVFYTMKSDTTNDWYTQRFDRASARWVCDCPSQKPCKHLRAVQEILRIRRARLAAKIGGDMPATIAQVEREQESRAEVAAATIAQAEAILREQRECARLARWAELERKRELASKDGSFSLLK